MLAAGILSVSVGTLSSRSTISSTSAAGAAARAMIGKRAARAVMVVMNFMFGVMSGKIERRKVVF